MANVISRDPGVITQPPMLTKTVEKKWDKGHWIYNCDVCGFSYPSYMFTVFEGKRYCSEHGCDGDIISIVRDRVPVDIPDDKGEPQL